MKTYKFLAVALVATGFFSACTNEEVVQPVNVNAPAEISFRLQGGSPETRTAATTLTDVDAFVVYGTDNVAAASNIFEGLTVARQLSSNSFEYSPKKYYSEGAASAQFVAFSPVTANITNPATTSLLTTASFDYTVVKPDNTGNITQEDLLIAGTGVSSISSTPVDLQFKHALSRIFVKASNTLSSDVIITGLSLRNLYSTGKITGTPGAAWTWTWATSGAKTDYEYELATTGVAVKAGLAASTLVTSMEQGMMVLPQSTVNVPPTNPATDPDFDPTTDFALEVTYDVGNFTGKKAYILLTDGYTFAAGSQYAINIAFSGTALNLIEINFTINVDTFGSPIVELP